MREQQQFERFQQLSRLDAIHERVRGLVPGYGGGSGRRQARTERT
jgi:hypothetical protein